MTVGNTTSASERPAVTGVSAAATLLLALLMLCIGVGCERKVSYSQETPDDVIASAMKMVKNGDSEQLSSLIYADSPEMRATLNQLGRLFGNMQKLSKAIAARFPQEMEEMKRVASEKVANGEAGSIFDQLVSNSGGGGRSGPRIKISTGGKPPASSSAGAVGESGTKVSVRVGETPPVPENPGRPVQQPRTPDENADMRNEFRDLINRLFADPYGWLETNGSRITTIKVSDDTATIMYDNQPLMGGLTLPMQQFDGKWYVVLPLNLPPLNQAMPKTTAQWSILRSMIQVIDKAVIDMTSDVQTGRVNSLDNLARNAQEKLMFPAVIAFGAYGKELDVAGRVDRRFKQFQERQKKWVKSRTEQAENSSDDGAKDVAAVSPKLVAAMNTVAPAEIEKVVRTNKRSEFEKLTDPEFEALAEGWLSNAGLKLKLGESVTADRVDSAIAAWTEARKKAAAAKPLSAPKAAK